MGTVRFTSHEVYLIVARDGRVRTRQRRPHQSDIRPSEYAFHLLIRIPHVQRETIAGRLELELPPDVDPDVNASVELAGPIDLCRPEDVAT